MGGFWRSYLGLLRVAVVAPELLYSCDGDAGKIDVPSAQPGDASCGCGLAQLLSNSFSKPLEYGDFTGPILILQDNNQIIIWRSLPNLEALNIFLAIRLWRTPMSF